MPFVWPFVPINTFPDNKRGIDALFTTAHTSRMSCRLRESVRNPARTCMRRWWLWTQRPQQHRSELSRQCWKAGTCSGGRHWAPLPASVSVSKDFGWVSRKVQVLPSSTFPLFFVLYVVCLLCRKQKKNVTQTLKGPKPEIKLWKHLIPLLDPIHASRCVRPSLS